MDVFLPTPSGERVAVDCRAPLGDVKLPDWISPDGNVVLYCADCLDILPTLEPESVDAVVCDPPYGLSFMGKDWDHGVPGVHFWEAVLRVAKPGAHLLAFGGTRTFHRLAVAIEDAGWQIRDTIMWLYGSGFPKSLDVSKAIDKAAGAKRERIRGVRSGVVGDTFAQDAWSKEFKDSVLSSEAITDAARQRQGWGTALKPAWEPIIVARKPLDGTVAANVLKHGTGALNVDGCRIQTTEIIKTTNGSTNEVFGDLSYTAGERWTSDPLGRFPANLILSYPEDEYKLRDNVTPEQLQQLAGWLNAHR